MNRREFTLSAAAVALGSKIRLDAEQDKRSHRLPASDHHFRKVEQYVETIPIPEYHWASEKAY